MVDQEVPEETAVSPDDRIARLSDRMQSFLADNPRLADALTTFGLAEEEYRRSLMALSSTTVTTSTSTNIQQ